MSTGVILLVSAALSLPQLEKEYFVFKKLFDLLDYDTGIEGEADNSKTQKRDSPTIH